VNPNVVCHKCAGKGHFANECATKMTSYDQSSNPNSNNNPTTNSSNNNPRSNYGRDFNRNTCRNCGEEGHWAAQCPNIVPPSTKNNNNPNSSATTNNGNSVSMKAATSSSTSNTANGNNKTTNRSAMIALGEEECLSAVIGEFSAGIDFESPPSYSPDLRINATDDFLGNTSFTDTGKLLFWTVTKIFDRALWSLADSGSCRNLMSFKLWEALHINSKLRPAGHTRVIGGNGQSLDLIGWMILKFSLCGRTVFHEVGIVRNCQSI